MDGLAAALELTGRPDGGLDAGTAPAQAVLVDGTDQRAAAVPTIWRRIATVVGHAALVVFAVACGAVAIAFLWLVVRP